MNIVVAPVILFVYNRPKHTAKVLKNLKNNYLAKKTDLLIFSDGPKNKEDFLQVKEVRNIINKIKGFKSITVYERLKNIGLSNNIVLGLNQFFKKNKTAIILEDDLIVDKYFLYYMNCGLTIYKNEKKVISIHGYSYPTKDRAPIFFFLKGADCWGWATWKRGWNIYNSNSNYLFEKLKKKNLLKKFDFENSYPYSRILRDNIKQKNISWATNWYASAFLKNKLTLYPGRSLVKNIGTDGSGTNFGNVNYFSTKAKLLNRKIEVKKIKIEECATSRNQCILFFNESRSYVSKFVNYLRKVKIDFFKKN
jgi:hypothetical protein